MIRLPWTRRAGAGMDVSTFRAASRTVVFLALRNIRRNVRGSLLSLVAIACGVTGLALARGFVEDMYQQLAERTIHSQLGHLQVTKAGFRDAGAGRTESFLIPQVASLKRLLASQPEVAAAMGRVGFSALLAGDREELAVEVEAVEPDAEARLGTQLVELAGRSLRGEDRTAVMLGEGVARQLRVRPGALLNLTTATFDGALNSYELEVVGVFRSISKEFDDRTVRVPLALAQDLLQTANVNTIVVELRHTRDTDKVLARLAGPMQRLGLEIHPWHTLSDFYGSVRDMYAQQFGILQIIALVLMVMSVVNSLNTTVYERTAEFGTMRALGNRNGFVFALIVTESLLIGLIAVVAAVLLSLASAALLSHAGIPMPPPPNSEAGYTARVLVTPGILLDAGVIGLLSALFASIAPAWRASSMPVAEGLQHAV